MSAAIATVDEARAELGRFRDCLAISGEPAMAYHGSGAWGHSALGYYAREGFERFVRRYITREIPSSPATPAMAWGSALDDLICTPRAEWDAKYVQRPEGMDFRTKDGKAWRDEQASAGRTVIDTEDWPCLFTASERVRRVLDGLVDGDRGAVEMQRSYRGRWDDQVLAQTRPDFCLAGQPRMVDLKATADIAKWDRDFVSKGYHLQTGLFYLMHLGAMGEPLETVDFLLVEAKQAYPRTRLVSLSETEIGSCVSYTLDVLEALSEDLARHAGGMPLHDLAHVGSQLDCGPWVWRTAALAWRSAPKRDRVEAAPMTLETQLAGFSCDEEAE